MLNYLAEEEIEFKSSTKSLQCGVKGAVFLVSKAFVSYELHM